MKLLLNTDGGSRDNPVQLPTASLSTTSLACRTKRPDQTAKSAVCAKPPPRGLVPGIIPEKCGKYIGETTNNIAEYQGVNRRY